MQAEEQRSVTHAHYLGLYYDEQMAFYLQWFKRENRHLIDAWAKRQPKNAQHPPIFFNLKEKRFEWAQISDENLDLYDQLVQQQLKDNNVPRRVFNYPAVVC